MHIHSPASGCGQRADGPLRPRHPAGRVVGPVAVETDHTPLDAPAHAEPAGVFQDRIVDGTARAVRHARDPMAEAARDGLRRASPRPECDLPDTIDAHELKIRTPELGFLVRALGVDL